MNLRKEIKEKLPNKEISLIALEEIEKIDEIIKEIIINDSDKEKKGRNALTDISYTHIGLSRLNTSSEQDDKPIIIIFSKDIKKNEIPENSLSNNFQKIEIDKNNVIIESQIDNKKISNLDNNETNEIKIEIKKEKYIDNFSSDKLAEKEFKESSKTQEKEENTIQETEINKEKKQQSAKQFETSNKYKPN